MNIFLRPTILFAILLLIVEAGAQPVFNSEPRVTGSAYFDESPQLRDMKIVMPGTRDRSWKDGIVQNEERDESEMYSKRVPVEQDMVLQETFGSRSVSGPINNFPGVGRITALSPPDTDGDVGPNHYFQMINVSFAIWDKQGNKLYGPVDNSTLWDGFIGPWTGTNDGDPIVLYDEYSDRWIASQFAVNTANGTYWQLVAVSSSPDPLGSYYRYAFEFDEFNDYPKLSVWPDGYYATFNMFGSGFLGATIVAWDRNAMINGDSVATMIEFGPFSSQYGAKTSHVDGPTLPPSGSPNWVANLRKYGSQALEIYKFEVDWTTPSNSTYVLWDDLAVTPFNFFDPNVRPQLPQPNNSQMLDPLSKYLMYPLQYRNFGTHESMVVNHTVKVANEKAGIRWYELRRDSITGHWSIYQEGTYAPAGNESRWMASIAMNGNGDIALGYSVTGDSTYPSIRYTGRFAGSPPGIMDIEEVTIIDGSGTQSGTARWGDYSYMAVDPVDDSTFWYTQEYMPGNFWDTRIAAFDFGPVLPPTAYAGEDSVICSEEVYYANGEASYAQSVLWESTGDGNLFFETTLTPAYIRGQGDLDSGYFHLILNAYGYEPGAEAVDTVMVEISFDVMVDAGNDTLICSDESLLLEGQAVNADTVFWTTSGDGTFNDSSLLNAIYTPGPDDILAGEVLLTLNGNSAAPCEGEDSDVMTLTIETCTGIDESSPQAALNIWPNPSSGLFNIDISNLEEETFSLRVINISGNTVFSGELSARNGVYNNQLDFRYLSKGIYYVILESNTTRTARKIVFN